MVYGEEKENALIRKLVMLNLRIKIWEETHVLMSREILVEVEHVKAHRTKKDKKDMSHFEKFVTDGTEQADELAQAGAMLDEGFVAEARANTVQQEEREKSVCSLAVRSQLSVLGGRMDFRG